MECMTDPANARFGEPHPAREGHRLTRSEEEPAQQTGSGGPAHGGAEKFGLRWDSAEFGDSGSGESVFGTPPVASPTDVPSYSPDYLTGTAVPALLPHRHCRSATPRPAPASRRSPPENQRSAACSRPRSMRITSRVRGSRSRIPRRPTTSPLPPPASRSARRRRLPSIRDRGSWERPRLPPRPRRRKRRAGQPNSTPNPRIRRTPSAASRRAWASTRAAEPLPCRRDRARRTPASRGVSCRAGGAASGRFRRIGCLVRRIRPGPPKLPMRLPTPAHGIARTEPAGTGTESAAAASTETRPEPTRRPIPRAARRARDKEQPAASTATSRLSADITATPAAEAPSEGQHGTAGTEPAAATTTASANDAETHRITAGTDESATGRAATTDADPAPSAATPPTRQSGDHAVDPPRLPHHRPTATTAPAPPRSPTMRGSPPNILSPKRIRRTPRPRRAKRRPPRHGLRIGIRTNRPLPTTRKQPARLTPARQTVRTEPTPQTRNPGRTPTRFLPSAAVRRAPTPLPGRSPPATG
ncbi:Uncharacterised protein [Nocardia africana]|uniref:Uncharacterized protein n=1 Tax=Nocardia africana TaxID=134964 RepID=A0A378X4R8_9NOCA|nr:Uncharacterised protein [Nocardia africana]